MNPSKWTDRSQSKLRKSNENKARNNNIVITRSCLSNVIMTGFSVYFALVGVLLFTCNFKGVVGKSLDVPLIGDTSVDRLAPADHIDGVKMEMDGHLNKNIHKEVFLGDLEDFEDIPFEERRAKLDEVFNKADTNQDEILELPELEAWIKKKLHEHFHDSVRENDSIFKTLDINKDGFLDWDEYLRMYLHARGYKKELVDKYLKYIDKKSDSGKADSQLYEDDQFFHNGDKDLLLRYKNRWEESDTEKTDNKLSQNEFLKFRHPEHRDDSMQEMAESIIHGLDKNGDQNLTIEEFVALPPGISSDDNTVEEDKKWQDERKKEFTDSIDQNKDGIVGIKELKAYLDPRNPIQIKNEATSILEMIDDDYDGKLSKEEVQRHETEFIYSKMVETARNFHDEF